MVGTTCKADLIHTDSYVCLFKGIHGISDDKKGDLEIISVVFQKANEPVSWHV